MRVDEFDYALPDELIAQTPLDNRSASRLMVIDPIASSIRHQHFDCIADELIPGDVLVVNNSRVLPARLLGRKLDTGGRVEILLTRRLQDREWEALCKPARRLHEGTVVVFPAGERAIVTSVLDDGLRRLRFELTEAMESFLNRVGILPLPPYIHASLQDPQRYQTVYAKPVGSVAAPTAGLHFTPELLSALAEQGVLVVEITLHVGLGTFRPVQVNEVEAHRMHSEWYEVTQDAADIVNQAKVDGRRVIAVGTTALRTLESAGQSGRLAPGSGETAIFIYPGYTFRLVDALITNFHLPKSTLLMLVSAWMGRTLTSTAYDLAVAERYRFFSFGDAMFITGRCKRVDAASSV